MPYDVVSRYDCEPSQVARARGWLHHELGPRLPARANDELMDDAALIVSELLTNAIRAGCDAVTVGFALEPGCLRLGVSDNAPGVPALQALPSNDAGGRGLPIVAALAQDWGVVLPSADHPKEVWATLSFG